RLAPIGGVVLSDDADMQSTAEVLKASLQADVIQAPKTAQEAEASLAAATTGGNIIIVLDRLPSDEFLGVLRQLCDFNDISEPTALSRNYTHPDSRVVVVFPRSVWGGVAEFPFIDLFGAVCRLDIKYA